MSAQACPSCRAASPAGATSCATCGHSLLATRTEGNRFQLASTRGVPPTDEMTVKGTAFLARRGTLERMLGSARVEELIKELARKYSIFHTPVLASTKIPASQWIGFNDALIERFYAGVSRTYWRFGQESADFALTGPYKHLVLNRDTAAFAQTVSTAWKVYYSHGRAEGIWEGDVFRYAIDDVPVHHIYFEYTACGWVERGLQMIGASVLRTRPVQGYSRGDQRVEYHFHVDLSGVRAPASRNGSGQDE